MGLRFDLPRFPQYILDKLVEITKRSIKENVEYAAVIYLDNNELYVSEPVRGIESGVQFHKVLAESLQHENSLMFFHTHTPEGPLMVFPSAGDINIHTKTKLNSMMIGTEYGIFIYRWKGINPTYRQTSEYSKLFYDYGTGIDKDKPVDEFTRYMLIRRNKFLMRSIKAVLSKWYNIEKLCDVKN